jgi:hypothetical protein
VHADPGSSVPQFELALKSAGALTPITCTVADPIFVTVTVCADEASPTCVFANVNALSLRLYASSTAALTGLADTTAAAVPLSATASGLLAASLSIVSTPLSCLGDVLAVTSYTGAYVSITAQLAPTASEAPQVLVE